MAVFDFHPPGNPLEWVTLRAFTPAWRRRTDAGTVCYFCGSSAAPTGYVPCCEAGDYWRAETDKRTARLFVQRAVRGLR